MSVPRIRRPSDLVIVFYIDIAHHLMI